MHLNDWMPQDVFKYPQAIPTLPVLIQILNMNCVYLYTKYTQKVNIVVLKSTAEGALHWYLPGSNNNAFCRLHNLRKSPIGASFHPRPDLLRNALRNLILFAHK